MEWSLRQAVTWTAVTAGHHAMRTTAICGPLMAVCNIGPLINPSTMTVFNVSASAIMVVMFYSLLQMRTHERNLCPRHINDAPLGDPTAAIQRRIRTLRYYHFVFGHGRRRTWIFIVVFFFLAVPLHFDNHWLDLIPTAVGVVPMSAALLAADLHRRLMPWCPMCHHPGDDGGYFSPDPTPDPAIPNPITT